ncbi:acyl-CoA thioesterase [Heyndrickxia sp. NPDC080065]|uniref:acyl-CoA thioesterase n=1 Tax=Heyndrickxia sp. NPDC080065 TaxID=3390568 RepID=UPI003D01B458
MKNISYIENVDEWKKGFTFFQPMKVRFSETDMFGHLNNTVPFAYFEEARIEFLKHKEFMQDWLKEAVDTIPVVADLQCDFIKQVYFDEKLKVYVKVNKIGTSSIDLHYMAINEQNDLCFAGRGAMVQISTITGKGVPWTEDEKVKLGTDQ